MKSLAPTEVEAETELTEEQLSELNRILGLDESERKSQRQGRTKIDNQRLDKVGRAIELLKQSLSEVMPNIVIYVAENSDAFAVVANEQKDRKQDRSRGYFRRVNGKYVIILNPDSADVTTVFHEGLHAQTQGRQSHLGQMLTFAASFLTSRAVKLQIFRN